MGQDFPEKQLERGRDLGQSFLVLISVVDLHTSNSGDVSE